MDLNNVFMILQFLKKLTNFVVGGKTIKHYQIGNVIVYGCGCLVHSLVVALERYLLPEVSRFVRMVRCNFAFRL